MQENAAYVINSNNSNTNQTRVRWVRWSKGSNEHECREWDDDSLETQRSCTPHSAGQYSPPETSNCNNNNDYYNYKLMTTNYKQHDSKHSIFQRLAMSSGPPHSLPQHLRFSEFLADIVRFIN